MLTRREFLRLIALAGPAASAASLALLDGGVALAQKPTPVPPPPYQKKGRIKQADRLAAARNRAKAFKAAGKKILPNTKMAPKGVTKLSGVTALSAPDYFGLAPNYANSPLPPSVSIWGDGMGAAATVSVSGGAVTGFAVTSGGSGYTFANVNVIGGGGAGGTGTATFGNGVITAITLTNGGTGYTTAPTITITDTPPGTGSGATATASVWNGIVTSVSLTNGGSGYTAPVITFSGPGAGATASATVSNGAIMSIAVATPGTGYTNPGIRKFVDSLAGLTAAGANDLGQYIPVAVPDTTTYANCDYYEIELGQYTEQLHKDLPPTTLRGYRQTNTADATVSRFSYLGPIIIAQKDRPVRIKFTNNLPTGTGGDLFIPVDSTVMGAGTGPNGGIETYKQNRATLHLHGGNTPWISDGTMHQWTTPAGETTSYPVGVSVFNVPDMGNPGPNPPKGTLTFYYTNQQSARLLFYHDHAYGITRLNVYAGEAAGYLITDPAEQTLVNGGNLTKADGTTLTVNPGTIPADQIPLIIQDKTFVPTPNELSAEDPTWDSTKYGGLGNLWLPHVYMPNQNPYDISGANAMGRWDYGPWFWPPFTGIQNGPIPNPLYPGTPGEPPYIPGTPNPSIVPEAFMDTPLVNGTVYPYLQVGKKAYRFRILNACNERYLNLQLYYAKSSASMWNPDGTLNDANAGEIPMVPAAAGNPGTAGYPKDITDGRDGGVPDVRAAGPQMIQIGTESGFLPSPVVLPNTPVGYDYNRRSITVLNVSTKTLFLGPAERADVIVDFSQVPDGAKIILYNDAPAPVPGLDPRNDYYTGDPDLTSTGGAPSTLPGYGPNTRTIMQFQVTSTLGTAGAFDLAALQAAVPVAFYQTQIPPILPDARYNAPYGANFPKDPPYARIQDTSLTFFNGMYGLQGITLTNGGSGYTAAPNVTISGGGGTGATATTTLAPRAVASVTVTNGGTGYTSAPGVVFSGGGGTGAAGTAVLAPTSVASVTVTNTGNGYTSVPTVSFSGGGGTGATATAVVTNRRVTAITVDNGGSGYTSAPTVTISGGGGSGATARANLAPRAVASVTVTNGGTGYTSAPTVAFSGGGGTGAQATAVLPAAAVASIALTNPGSGYISAPTIAIDPPPSGTTATAVASGTTLDLEPKSIIEDFDVNYGRMNAMLGVEVPHTSATIQTSIPYYDIDPPTEILIANPEIGAAPIGSKADGTQIWKITHNGVDTHTIHWHKFDVQLINRVGWDGAVKPPDANELGLKESIRMNPLEDIILALRPAMLTNLPWDLPNNHRLLDVTMPVGSTMGFRNVDPTNQPARVTNVRMNFGWEYVVHCHLLGHEENIMMRPMIFAVRPKAPTLSAPVVAPNGRVTLTWTDNSVTETEFRVLRATAPAGPWTLIRTVPSTTEATTGTVYTYTDTTASKGKMYYYQVVASNVVGYTQTYAAPAVGYPHPSADSGSMIYSTAPGSTPLPPANLAVSLTPPAGIKAVQPMAGSAGVVYLTWTDQSEGEYEEDHLNLQRATDPGFTANLMNYNLLPDTTSYPNTQVDPGVTYYYRLRAYNEAGLSGFSNTVNITIPTGLPAPSGLVATGSTQTTIGLKWVDNSTNETGFYIERSADGKTGWTRVGTVGAGITTFTDKNLNAGTIYYYRVQAYSGAGLSAYSNVLDAATKAGQLPAAPTQLAATGSTQTTISIKWVDNSTNETGFYIERSADGKTGWTRVGTVGAGIATFTNSALKANTVYYYRVQAYNSAGVSAYTNILAAKTKA